ncbi:MAG: A/G-specific adenine glycosylase, partial [Ilumatobacteraceae bacterium]
MEQRLNDDDLGVFQDALLGWAAVRLREMPWRATRDPWGILVSEVMLQQTGVARVMPKWHAFMESFPTPADCAHAALGDVLRVWQGLGYPRRARNLQAAAREVVVHHGGEVPQELDDLLALPGVGPYTARAVLAFAFELDAAVVAPNV